jgi:tetratricopeptide (TPR) repeat protein
MARIGGLLERPDPDEAWASVMLAWIDFDRDRVDAALAAQTRAGQLCALLAHHDREASCPYAEGLRARLLIAVGRAEEGEAVAKASLAKLAELQFADGFEAMPAKAALAEALWARGRRDDAIAALRPLAGSVEESGTRSSLAGIVRRRLATYLIEAGGSDRLSEAASVLRDARPVSQRFNDMPDQLFVEAQLALAQGRRDEALRLARESVRALEKRRPWSDRAWRITREWLARVERSV